MQAYLARGSNGLHTILPQTYDLRDRTWRDAARVMAEIAGRIDDPEVFGVGGLTFELRCIGCHSSQPSLTIDPGTGRFE